MEKIDQDVLHDYERTLVIPKNKPTRQFLLCPVGLVGAGKTTVTKPLAEKLSLVRISGDEIRKLLKAKGVGYDTVFDIAKNLIKKYLESGYSVAIDSDCASEKTLKNISEMEKSLGVRTIWIHVNPPESFIINKLKNFKHTWLFKNGDEAVKNYMRRKFIHEKLDMSFTYTFDTSKKNIEGQIQDAVEVIKKEIVK